MNEQLNHPTQVFLRAPKTEDESLIYNSWLNSYKDSDDNPIKDGRYWGYQKDIIYRILERSTVLIACNPLDHDQIYGYLVYEPRKKDLIIHWGYMKQTWRRLGIMKYMVSKLIKELNLDEHIMITSRGISYNTMKNKFLHTFKPSLIWDR